MRLMAIENLAAAGGKGAARKHNIPSCFATHSPSAERKRSSNAGCAFPQLLRSRPKARGRMSFAPMSGRNPTRTAIALMAHRLAASLSHYWNLGLWRVGAPSGEWVMTVDRRRLVQV
jgi:hypothetical protein